MQQKSSSNSTISFKQCGMEKCATFSISTMCKYPVMDDGTSNTKPTTTKHMTNSNQDLCILNYMHSFDFDAAVSLPETWYKKHKN